MHRKIDSLEEQLYNLGLHKDLVGGQARLNNMVRLFGEAVVPPTAAEPVIEAAAVSAPVPAAVPAADAAALAEAELDALYEGETLTEELLELLEATLSELDEEVMDEARLAQVQEYAAEILEKLASKEVPDDLVERAQDLVQDLVELKKIRIVGGKVTRVNVRRGGKAQKEKRKRRIQYKRKRAHIKITTKKRERKAGAKIKASKTARKRKSIFGAFVKKAGKKLSAAVSKVKKKFGLMATKGVKGESQLMSDLRALLQEDVQHQPQARDRIMVRLGDIAEHIEYLFWEDEDAVALLAERYEDLADEYCNGALVETKVDEAAFCERVAPFGRLIGKFEDALGNG